MPLTEPDVRIARIRLFSKTHPTGDSVYRWCTIRGVGSG
jgi:hypothetical protein